MKRRIRMTLVALGLVGALLGSAAPAMAACLNPTGEHNGWEACSPCCERPRGNANGWEKCDCGNCINPRGEINGWAPCSAGK